MTNTTIFTQVTIGEGVVRRKYEETASRDHDVTLVPGTYPIKAKFYNGGNILDSYHAAIPAIAHDHWSSTVEFGGVALAGKQRGGESETYSLFFYGFQVDKMVAAGNQGEIVFS